MFHWHRNINFLMPNLLHVLNGCRFLRGLMGVVVGVLLTFFVACSAGPDPIRLYWEELRLNPYGRDGSTVVIRGWCAQDGVKYWLTENRLEVDESPAQYNSIELNFGTHAPNCLGTSAQWAEGTFSPLRTSVGLIELWRPLCVVDPTRSYDTGTECPGFEEEA